MFEGLEWRRDRVLLNGLTFRLEQEKDGSGPPGDFDFYKGKWTVDQYERFFASHPGFRPRDVFELGIWDGGSSVFWFETLQPQKLVAIDVSERGDSKRFREVVAARGLSDRLKTHWGVDQSDSRRLREIVQSEFGGSLDLVLDDASHAYEETKASFEALFPLIRPGGFYVIEDWAWGHFEEFQHPDHPWAGKTELTKLVTEIVEATGSSQTFGKRIRLPGSDADTVVDTLVESVLVYPHFAAVQRGDADLRSRPELSIEAFISRRLDRLGASPFTALCNRIRRRLLR